MPKYLLPILLTGLVCFVPVRANDIAQHVNESRALVEEFLKGRGGLRVRIRRGGPLRRGAGVVEVLP